MTMKRKTRIRRFKETSMMPCGGCYRSLSFIDIFSFTLVLLLIVWNTSNNWVYDTNDSGDTTAAAFLFVHGTNVLPNTEHRNVYFDFSRIAQQKINNNIGIHHGHGNNDDDNNNNNLVVETITHKIIEYSHTIENIISNNDDPTMHIDIELDVSHSELGDTGLSNLADHIFSSTVIQHTNNNQNKNTDPNIDINTHNNDDEKSGETTTTTTTTRSADQSVLANCARIGLTSHMNRITPLGATAFLNKQLLAHKKAKRPTQTTISKESTDTDMDSKQINHDHDHDHDDGDDEGKAKSSTIKVPVDQQGSQQQQPPKLTCLDLGWNNFHPDESGFKSLWLALRKTIQDCNTCPLILRLDCCSIGPALCRAIGKGIVNRYKQKKKMDINTGDGNDLTKPTTTTNNEKKQQEQQTQQQFPIMSLYLCGNPDVGNGGAAALAAAIKASNDPKKSITRPLFNVLNLSACGIGDAGVETLAMALERSSSSSSSSIPICRRLVLSHNKLTNTGAVAIANCLQHQKLNELELDGNIDIGNVGARALAEVMGKAKIRKLSLRSCNVSANGSQAIANAIKSLAISLNNEYEDDNNENVNVISIEIDLSGNPIGTLQTKKKKDGKRYSPSALKSKATAATADYMNKIGKRIQSGLKNNFGLEGLMPSSESDDDEEGTDRMENEKKQDDDDLASGNDIKVIQCGARTFADVILEDEEGANSMRKNNKKNNKSCRLFCKLCFRRACLDLGGCDALAAAKLHAEKELGIDIEFDVGLNSVLEEEIVDALAGRNGDVLEDMADRHNEMLESMRLAEERVSLLSEPKGRRGRRGRGENGRIGSMYLEEEDDDALFEGDDYNYVNDYDENDDHEEEYEDDMFDDNFEI